MISEWELRHREVSRELELQKIELALLRERYDDLRRKHIDLRTAVISVEAGMDPASPARSALRRALDDTRGIP